LLAGRRRSFNPAATRHHFIIGAQKNTVFGPMREANSGRVRTESALGGVRSLCPRRRM
jgi:hypothetical protein